MNIYFFNFHGFGDIHISRTYINDIINNFDINSYTFYYFSIHKNNILKDIEKIQWITKLPNHDINEHSEFCIKNNNIFINTWYCHGHGKFFDTHCSLYTLYKIFTIVYKNLNIELKEFYYYIPKVNIFQLQDYKTLKLIKDKKQYRKKILICANNVTSNQCPNFDFITIIDEVSKLFNQYLFIVTVDYHGENSNIISTYDVYKQDFDLNQISHLSNYCDVIVGRASGAYTFTITKENVNNPTKKFICFSEFKIYAIGMRTDEAECQIYWYNQYNLNFIKNKIIEVIK